MSKREIDRRQFVREGSLLVVGAAAGGVLGGEKNKELCDSKRSNTHLRTPNNRVRGDMLLYGDCSACAQGGRVVRSFNSPADRPHVGEVVR